MYAYVSSYLVLLSFCSFYLFLETKKSDTVLIKVLFFVGLIPSIIFVIFRGNVGTDTGTYLQMVQDIGLNPTAERNDFDIEIGFYLLLKAFSSLFHHPRVVINLVTAIIATYCINIFSRSKEQFLVFSFLVFPLFFFDMTMNGLRYALSFLLAKHASDEYANNNKFKSLVLFVACISFQLSGLLVFLLLRIRNFKFSTIAFALPLAMIFYSIFDERLAYKFIAYTQLESPDFLSGVLPLGVFLACYFNMMLIDRKFVKKFIPLLILEVASFILAKFTYAGLRFQLLILFVFFCLISEVNLNEYKRKVVVLFLFFLIGLIGFAGTLKHYVDDANMPPSPFLPYRFFWEEE
jgi:EpsG family